MPFDDFLTHFSEMSVCRLINTSIFSLSKTWKEIQLFGSWKDTTTSNGSPAKIGGARAGGCLNHPDTFLNNPQYRYDYFYKLAETNGTHRLIYVILILKVEYMSITSTLGLIFLTLTTQTMINGK